MDTRKLPAALTNLHYAGAVKGIIPAVDKGRSELFSTAIPTQFSVCLLGYSIL